MKRLAMLFSDPREEGVTLYLPILGKISVKMPILVFSAVRSSGSLRSLAAGSLATLAAAAFRL